MYNIGQLLQAAEFIERRDREAEHGYASTLPMPSEYNSHHSSKRRSKTKKTPGNRSTHNELEKNRRAQLRNYLDRLKDLVPTGVDSSRHTTLGLLTKARSFIKNLEDKERKSVSLRDQLERENRMLRRRLEQLNRMNQTNHNLYRVRQERSISECSTSTNSSSSSSLSSTSSVKSEESDEIDIIGGFQSDNDDRCSVQSLGSDGGGSGYSNHFSDDSGLSSL